ncbi:protein FAM162A isoform X1 [Gopherus evgoodei]|uniref:Family with sequence similarity 162 member A n=3 Tax=Gopherus TaxID=38771 RepID=A0A8C4VMP3_9SAUR|nr:protein FAM162A isoform X1 [Gopherus evgoodei]
MAWRGMTLSPARRSESQLVSDIDASLPRPAPPLRGDSAPKRRRLEALEASAMWAAAGRATKMLERNFSSILSPTKRMDLKIKRGFCSKSQEGSKQKPEVGGHSTFKVPGHKPTDWEKKVLMWSGRFKKVDDIPETVSLELIDAARNKLRVKMSYLMIAVTVLGCIVMVIEGKRAVGRHESLTTQNIERKVR